MRVSLLFALFFSATVVSVGQSTAPPAVAPNELVRKVVANEIQAGDQDHSHWMYQSVSAVPAPAKTKIVVETKSGDVSYLIEIDGHPLTPQQASAEAKRVQKFVNDPNQQRNARRASEADDKQTARLFAMLPNAFIYRYDKTEGDNTKLTFQPNPSFTSHSSEGYVFHKMTGYIIVNTKENRLVEISGRLTKGVQFLGGVLGHLDAGGTFDVCRQEISPGHWNITKLKVNMNGKILFFKTISEKQDEVHSHFQRIADATTLNQAEEMAEKKIAVPPAG